MKTLFICLVLAWSWRVAYLVSKAKITRFVGVKLRTWASLAWPVTFTLWAFIGSSQVAADWVGQLLPGDTQNPEAATDDHETIIEEESPEPLETIPD
jgi:hypothetical protein